MLEGLNPEQAQAVRYIDGPSLVLAGAGSGKTRVITAKLVHLIKTCGFNPSTLLAVTFTNKAAKEMQMRLSQQLGAREAKIVTLSTFHGFGLRLLKEVAAKKTPLLPLRHHFSILDSDDTQGLLQQAAGTDDRVLLKYQKQQISLWKSALVDPPEAMAGAENDNSFAAAKAYLKYQELLVAYNAVDFDDLIGWPVKLLEEDRALRNDWQDRLRHVLIDEYQDTSHSQYRLLRLLVGPQGRFTAVGDDDQAIYAWRGASSENLVQLKADYPRLEVIKLERNYRSTAAILSAANQLIANNPKVFEKELRAQGGLGLPIQTMVCQDDDDEAERVVRGIALHRSQNRGKWAEYAVLYRGNHQSRAFEQALRKEGIPYKVSGGQSFFERAEVKDLLAYLRLIANEDDDPAFLRAIATPRRGIGPVTLRTLSEYAAMRECSLFEALFEHGIETKLQPRALEPLRDFGEMLNRIKWRARTETAVELIADLNRLVDLQGYYAEVHDERTAKVKIKNLTDFVSWLSLKAENDGMPLPELAQKIALLSQIDRSDQDSDLVNLSTLHAAKGLEWPHVYMVGFEEGLLPHLGGSESSDEEPPSRIEEERRLAYVGITRARETLTLTWCAARKKGKSVEARFPSRFLAEMGLCAEQTKVERPQGNGREAARALLAGLRERSSQTKIELNKRGTGT